MEKIAVVGLGYVGLPLAVALAKKFSDVLGVDISEKKINDLTVGRDSCGALSPAEIRKSGLRLTTSFENIRDRTFVIVAVPTPIDEMKQPNLAPLISASRAIGRHLAKEAVVVYESTVYPGATEEVCGPALREAGARDFYLGYSPERINPGDKEHTLATVVKIVSGDSSRTLERVRKVYEKVALAGVYEAPSIRVAEAAKVIENTQRDLNIALMNELAIIFDRMQISTREVLKAAGTKWNFLPFKPGLVGGECIPTDPFYLTAKAQSLGYYPEVILSGRRINDGMGSWIAQKCIKLLSGPSCEKIHPPRVCILGVSFKENVPDIRNIRVPEMVDELRQFGAVVSVCDPIADPDAVFDEHWIELLTDWQEQALCAEAVILAVPHKEFDAQSVIACIKPRGLLMDVKSAIDPKDVPSTINYWSL